jgi:hypothetical protein
VDVGEGGVGDVEVLGPGHADVGEHDVLPVELRRIQPERLGALEAHEQPAAAGVEERADVLAFAVAPQRLPIAGVGEVSVHARLVEGGVLHALDVDRPRQEHPPLQRLGRQTRTQASAIRRGRVGEGETTLPDLHFA